MTVLRFADIDWLWLLAALPLLLLIGAFSLARRRRALARFAGGVPQAKQMAQAVSGDRRIAKRLLAIAGLAFAILALARPQWGSRVEEVEGRGADVIIMLDHSLSMLATDVAPNRLDLARHLVRKLSERLEGDRLGLISFSGQAELNCPLTLDQGALRLFVDTIDAEATPVPGTALAQALQVAISAFERDERTDVDGRHRAIVLLTDGEDHEGGLEPIVERLNEAGISIFTIGAGTQRGAPIPIGNGFKKDADGKVVTTRLDELLLESLARETQGQYHRGEFGGDSLDRIAEGIRSMGQAEFQATLRTRYEERFQWPLGVALALLLIESLLGERRRQHNAATQGTPGGQG